MPSHRRSDPERRTWVPEAASYVALFVPLVATVAVSDPPSALPLLWLVGALPVAAAATAGEWRRVALVGGGVVASVVALHLSLAAGGRPVPPLLPEVLVALLFVTAVVAGLAPRIGDPDGADDQVALTDSLTGLPNRRHARVFIETMFGAAERGRPVAVVLFDLDRFQTYRREFGADAESSVLVRFAELLAASTRRMNLSARIGDEEFLSVLAGADEEGARAFADRIRESFQNTHLERGTLTVSAGVATYHPSMRSPDELVAAADLALFRAKSQGRNRVRVFGHDVDSDPDGIGQRPGDGPDGEESPTESPAAPSRTTAHWTGDVDRLGTAPPPRERLPEIRPQFGEGRTVLVVEHGQEIEEAVGGFLRSEGFDVAATGDAGSAIQSLGREFDVILTDLHLPGLSGTELVRAVKSRWPATQVIVVADSADARIAADALSAGGDRFLQRPLSLPEFQTQLIDALARCDRIRSEHKRRHEQSKESFRTEDETRKTVVRGILSLARAAEMHDPDSRGHSARVAENAQALLRGLRSTHDSDPDIDPDLLELACLVHNVGMLEVPPEILNKNGPLTPEEFERVRRHPETGRQILEPLLGDELILAVAGWHHERWDGSGYPDGLAGEAIPLPSRLVAIADALDAMTSPRPYRRALDWEDAVRQVRDRAGTHFDPGLIPAFNAALPDLHRAHRRHHPEPRGPEDGDEEADPR